MAIDNPTASLVHDKRRAKKDETYPVKLSVDYAGRKMRYQLPISCSIEDWEKIRGGKRLVNDELKQLKTKLNYYVDEKFKAVLRQIQGMDREFSFDLFKELYFKKAEQRVKQYRVHDLFQVKIERLHQEGRIGTANSNRDAQKSFDSFRPKLNLKEITVDFLNAYETYMLRKGCKPSTIGMYTRALRAIVNEAMYNRNDPVSMDYPFSESPQDCKYKIPVGMNRKKALPKSALEMIKNYEPRGYGEARAKAFWLFSYYCNGANFTDILHLTFQDMEGEYLVFQREKTKRSKRKPKIIKAFLREEMKQIIQIWGNSGEEKGDFIFPVLNRGLTEEREHQLVKQFVRVTNKYLNKITESLGIDHVSTYAARHSYATTLKRNGVDVAFIADSLGHSNVTITENYLAGFEDDTIKKNADLL